MEIKSKTGMITLEQSREIGGFCKSLRMHKGVTRDEAAAETGLSKSWIQKFETHEHIDNVSNFPPKNVMTYCNYLGIESEAKYTFNYSQKIIL